MPSGVPGSAEREFATREESMKAVVRLGIAVMAVAVFSAAGMMAHAQAPTTGPTLVPQPLPPQVLQPPVLAPQVAVQPADRAKVLEALGRGDFTAAEKIVSELQAQLQANIAFAPQGGSVIFEELKACGFYPQETRLACVIEIKQQFGYAGPVGALGSMEHVYFCIDWDNNGVFTQLESAGQGSVQMHDDPQAVPPGPPWLYAVYRDFNPFGGSRTSNTGVTSTTVSSAITVRVKATLSWFFAPTGCNYVPVWGNSLVFQIRMDPVR